MKDESDVAIVSSSLHRSSPSSLLTMAEQLQLEVVTPERACFPKRLTW